MNFGEIKTEVFRRLNESSSSPVFWTEADVEESINLGYQELADVTGFYERHVTMDLLSHRTYYDMRFIAEDTWLGPRRIFNNQTSQWLIPGSVNDHDAELVMWENVTGEPQRFFMRGTWWLGLWPKPNADSGTIRVYFAGTPADFTVAEQEPDFPLEFHEGLIEYGVYDLLAQDAETAKALEHWKVYRVYEAGLKQWMDKRLLPDRVGSWKP